MRVKTERCHVYVSWDFTIHLTMYINVLHVLCIYSHVLAYYDSRGILNKMVGAADVGRLMGYKSAIRNRIWKKLRIGGGLVLFAILSIFYIMHFVDVLFPALCLE